MIQIRIDTEQSHIASVQIRGHADSAPCGQDLVCCAVSAIAIGTLNALDSMFPEACELSMGDEIAIKVLQDSDDLQIALETMVWQLRSVAEVSEPYMRITETKQPLSTEEKEV